MFGIDVEFDKKKNGLLERNYIKAKKEMWPPEISELYCWKKLVVGLESPGKKLAVRKKCERWKLGITPKSEKKLTVERNNKESLKK